MMNSLQDSDINLFHQHSPSPLLHVEPLTMADRHVQYLDGYHCPNEEATDILPKISDKPYPILHVL